MDHHQLSQQQGYQHHPCYNQDNPGHNHSIHGHNQDSFHHQYNHGGAYDTYSTHQHQTQFSPEYQGKKHFILINICISFCCHCHCCQHHVNHIAIFVMLGISIVSDSKLEPCNQMIIL